MPKIAMIFLLVALVSVSLGPTYGEEPLAQDELIRERIRSMSIYSDANARKNLQASWAKVKERAEWMMEQINSYNLKVNNLQKIPAL